MGHTESQFAARMANKAAGNAFVSQGNKILRLAEVLKPYIADWLKNARTRDGMPVQPATVRAIALNTAQYMLKQNA